MRRKHLILVVLAALPLIAVPALATPGSGASATTLARGLAVEKLVTRGNQPYDVVVQELTIAPGGQTGWHTHPGNAVAVVKSGTLTIYDANDRTCTGTPYTAGSVYVDPGYGFVHLGRNESSTTPLEIVVAYLDVPAGGGGVRIDAAAPGNCPF
jgi:uncharacterized RmlC-like cupin family protein